MIRERFPAAVFRFELPGRRFRFEPQIRTPTPPVRGSGTYSLNFRKTIRERFPAVDLSPVFGVRGIIPGLAKL
jgi:hypothetical protein